VYTSWLEYNCVYLLVGVQSVYTYGLENRLAAEYVCIKTSIRLQMVSERGRGTRSKEEPCVICRLANAHGVCKSAVLYLIPGDFITVSYFIPFPRMSIAIHTTVNALYYK
jgi:hypothetical protein